jgi:hypothetical protein
LASESAADGIGNPGQATGGLTIDVTYDDTVANAPAGFTNVVGQVVQYFESIFTDPVTITIEVGWGEANDHPLGRSELGESQSVVDRIGYSQLRSALLADAASPTDAAAMATVPATDPSDGGQFFVTQAEAKALGLVGRFQPVDGYVGFGSDVAFDYDRSDGIAPGAFDFFGVVAHEFSEVMGRVLGVGETIGSVANSEFPLDLFHYAAPGERQWSGTAAGYFSTNGGATDLADFSTTPGTDFGDWAASAGNDAFRAQVPGGVLTPITAADIAAMDAIGWDADPAAVAASSAVAADGTAPSAAAVTSAATQLAQALAASGGEAAGPAAPVAASDDAAPSPFLAAPSPCWHKAPA